MNKVVLTSLAHVETTSAPVWDDARTAIIHEGLKHKDLLPDQHSVDTGSVDATLLIDSQQDSQIDLIGPTRANYRRPARQKTGFDARQFVIDWQAEQAACPEGHTSLSWTPALDNRTNEVIKITCLRHRRLSLSQSETVHPFDSSWALHGHDPTEGAV